MMLSSKICLIIFFLIDHYLWLLKLNIVKWGAKNDIFKASMRIFMVTHCLNFILSVKRLKELLECLKYTDEKKKSLITQSLKSLLMVVQAGHASQLIVTNDACVGLAGVITGIIDCRIMWNTEYDILLKKSS